MTGTSFVLRGLWFFRKSYLGVLAGASLGAMVLLGALFAGDSVKATLRQVAAARLGKVEAVLVGGDRFFRAALADDLTNLNAMAGLTPYVNSVVVEVSRMKSSVVADAAPVLIVKATATVQRSGRALGGVQVLGVDRRFWHFAPGADQAVEKDLTDGTLTPQDREFFINPHLARSLDLKLEANETLVLRFDKPGMIARDAPLAGKAAEVVALSGSVGEICDDARFGRFSLEATQLPQATVFVPLERLQQALGLEGKANLMLLRKHKRRGHSELSESVNLLCTPADYGLTVEEVPLAKAFEVRTSRIFFDRQVAAAIQQRFPSAQPVITYMANTIAANGRTTPYSMVTAVDPQAAPFLPNPFDGVVLNQWEAGDLGAKTGDEVRIDYYALEGGRHLVERSTRLPVAGVVPLTDLAADRRWMPDFPGVAQAEHAADWDAGVPIDLKRIRDKDEAYWDAHRGTPKLFMPLKTGRELFGNRWGEFTALRVPAAQASRDEVAAGLLGSLSPALAGLVLKDVGADAMAAAGSSADFAGLLLGMSLFLMAAAVALTAMLFRFHIEQRNRESGLLAALGIRSNKIMRWRLLEGLCVVAAGSGIGALLALGYTRLLLDLLESIWGATSGGRFFRFHADPATVSGGVAGFIVLMMVVIWFVARGQARRSVSLRLEAGTEEVVRTPARPVPWVAVECVLLGGAALASTTRLGVPGAFFLAGFLFLLGGMAAYRWVLRRRVAATTGGLSPRRLTELNCGRRATRSLVVVGTLACGVFLVVSVAAFRKHGGDEWKNRDSGAGGFAFWVETTSGVNRGNKTGTSNDVLELGAARGQFGRVLPFRVGPGDDASCFNLNSVTRPRLLGTDAAVLTDLGAFSIKQVLPGCAKSWNTLREGDVLRAFVDETTLLWVLKKKLGDRLVYQDEWGRDFPVEIAGTLDDTVFQGSLVVDEAHMLEHYPSAEGPRIFLLESKAESGPALATLQQALADRGAMVTTTRERLAAFNQVENTYIAIFNLLGGLGVLIGSAGLGLVTARNLLERRYEFAILHTVGIPNGISRRIVLSETAHFIRWGLGIGLAASVVAILPVLSAGGFMRSLAWVGLLTGLIAANAWFCSWLGLRKHLRTALSAALEFG